MSTSPPITQRELAHARRREAARVPLLKGVFTEPRVGPCLTVRVDAA